MTLYIDPSDNFALPLKVEVKDPVQFREDDSPEYEYESEKTQELDFDILGRLAEGACDNDDDY